MRNWMSKTIIGILVVLLLAAWMPAAAQSEELRCYRVVHDDIAFGGIREFGSGFTGTWYPAVFPFTLNPKSGDAAYKITPAWYQYIVADQPEILRWMGGGWLNTSQNKSFGWSFGEYVPKNWNGEPLLKAEALTTTGNLVCGYEVNGAVKVLHYVLSDGPRGDYYHEPWLYVKGTSINKLTGALGKWDGKDVTFANLAAVDALYLDLQYLEALPALPMTVKALTGLNVREYPTVKAAVIDRLESGEAVRIVEYHFWGSDVWAELSTGGWINVCYGLSWTAVYYTSWQMQTDPPLNTYPRTEQPLSDFVSAEATATPTATATAIPTWTATPEPDGSYDEGYLDGWNAALEEAIITLEGLKR